MYIEEKHETTLNEISEKVHELIDILGIPMEVKNIHLIGKELNEELQLLANEVNDLLDFNLNHYSLLMNSYKYANHNTCTTKLIKSSLFEELQETQVSIFEQIERYTQKFVNKDVDMFFENNDGYYDELKKIIPAKAKTFGVFKSQKFKSKYSQLIKLAKEHQVIWS